MVQGSLGFHNTCDLFRWTTFSVWDYTLRKIVREQVTHIGTLSQEFYRKLI